MSASTLPGAPSGPGDDATCQRSHDDESGSSHIGESGFGAGLFYSYICVDRDLLVENLSGDLALASKAIEGLLKAACTVSPTGKQNSHASRAANLFSVFIVLTFLVK